MQDLYSRYKDKGLVVLGFPCNQFGGQEPWEEKDILSFIQKKFNVTFPMFSKIDINGDKTDATYTFLKKCFPGDITWNFATKFLVDPTGKPIRRFEKEDWKDIEKAIVTALEQVKVKEESKEEPKKEEK